MGKGDKRSRRGKIFAGSFGKTRQKAKKSLVIPEAKTAAPAAKPEKKPRAAVKVKKQEAEAPAAVEASAEVEAAPVEETPAVEQAAGENEQA